MDIHDSFCFLIFLYFCNNTYYVSEVYLKKAPNLSSEKINNTIRSLKISFE